MSERLRIVAKRVDHIERAYRKEERPLLSRDYDIQQKADRENFATVQQMHKEEARLAHEEAVSTKHRLVRMADDYRIRREEIIARKATEFARKKEAAHQKIEEEKAKRRKAVLKSREEERQRLEKEEKIRREREEEEARLEAGK